MGRRPKQTATEITEKLKCTRVVAKKPFTFTSFPTTQLLAHFTFTLFSGKAHQAKQHQKLNNCNDIVWSKKTKNKDEKDYVQSPGGRSMQGTVNALIEHEMAIIKSTLTTSA